MWLEEAFAHPKPIIGMVHLDSLPGSAGYAAEHGLNRIIHHAREDYEALVNSGIDGVIFCNENDKPYAKSMPKETVAAMTAVVLGAIQGMKTVPFGIDMQWDPFASLAIAGATGAAFIRGIVCGTYCGDLGLLTPDTAGIIQYRRALGAEHVRIITNLMPEFSYSLDRRPVTLVSQTVTKSAGVDGICISGVIKFATHYNCIRPMELKALRAACMASLATGAPISTHTERGTMGLEVIELVKENGVDPRRVILGHVDRNPDLEYHKKMAAQGVTLGYDGPSRAKYWPDSVLIALIKGMCDAGYADHILLGGDNGRASMWPQYGGGYGHNYIIEKFVPRLLEGGVSENDVHKFLYDNPMRQFSFAE